MMQRKLQRYIFYGTINTKLSQERKRTMKEILLNKAIESYLDYVLRYKNYEREYLQNMKVFLEYLNETADGKKLNLRYKKECEALLVCAYELVVCKKKECPDLKSTKLERAVFCNSFVDYLQDATLFNGGKTKVEKLPPVMNDLERKLDYVKNFRENNAMRQDDVAAKYYVDAKTIRNDKREIQDGYFNAFGQKIDIDYDHENKSIFSTPVPIVMVQNITQIVAMLNGLGIMAQDARYRVYAENSAYTIWKQLTQYVKESIMNELIDALHLDRVWYEHIDRNADRQSSRYFTEKQIAANENNILLFYKNRMVVDVYYYDENDELQLMVKTTVTDAKQGYFELNRELQIPYENLVNIEPHNDN